MKKSKSVANHTHYSHPTHVMSQLNRPPKLSKIKNDRTYSWKTATPTNQLMSTWSNPLLAGCNLMADSNKDFLNRCSAISTSSKCSTRLIWCPNSKIARLLHNSKWWTCRPFKSSICSLNLCSCPNNLLLYGNRSKLNLSSTHQRRAYSSYRLKVKI